MIYNKTTWKTGDVITEDKLNNIENGIGDVVDEIAKKQDKIDVVKQPINLALETSEKMINFNKVSGTENTYIATESQPEVMSFGYSRNNTINTANVKAYIKIPYTLGQVLQIPFKPASELNYSGSPKSYMLGGWFGHTNDDGSITPVITQSVRYVSGSSTAYSGLYPYVFYNFTNNGSGLYTASSNVQAASFNDTTASTRALPVVFVQITGSTIDVQGPTGYPDTPNFNNYTTSGCDYNYDNYLTIDCFVYCPIGQENIDTSLIGVYDVPGRLGPGMVTSIEEGKENLFNVNSEDKLALSLNIGDGLSIVDGKLTSTSASNTESLENFTREGNITVSDAGIMSNFSSSNYGKITIPTLPNSTSKIEYIVKFKATTERTYNMILGINPTGKAIQINLSNKLFTIWSSPSGGLSLSTPTTSLNTWYWGRVVNENGKNYLYLIPDEGFTLDTLPDVSDGRYTSTSATANFEGLNNSIHFNGATAQFGIELTNTTQYLYVDLDLTGFSIKADDKVVYTPFNKTNKELTLDVTNLNNTSLITKAMIDGQWVKSFVQLSDSGSAGTLTMDLSSYLPNDDYNYDVKVLFYIYTSGDESNYNLYSDLMKHDSNFGYVNSSLRSNSMIFDIPVSTQRSLTRELSKATNSCQVYAFGYRRMGTNQ